MEGNFGSTAKLDYTVLGNTVNLAARLESLTRVIRRAVTMSGEVRQLAGSSLPFQHVGAFQLKGQDQPCPVYSLDDPLVMDFLSHDELMEAAAPSLRRECL